MHGRFGSKEQVSKHGTSVTHHWQLHAKARELGAWVLSSVEMGLYNDMSICQDAN